MIQDAIFGSAVGEGRDVCVVAVRQDSHSAVPQHLRQQIGRPEDAGVGGPGLVGMAIQTMDQDDVNLGLLGGTVNLGQAVLLDPGGERGHREGNDAVTLRELGSCGDDKVPKETSWGRFTYNSNEAKSSMRDDDRWEIDDGARGWEEGSDEFEGLRGGSRGRTWESGRFIGGRDEEGRVKGPDDGAPGAWCLRLHGGPSFRR